MSGPDSRIITFAGSSVAVEYEGMRAARIIAFLFRHLPDGDGGRPQVTYRLAPGASPDDLALYRRSELVYRGDSDAALAERLLGEVGHSLAAHSRGGLLFHAGGLAWGDQGLLLPGSIGAGKTTLTAWLAAAGIGGLAYLSDEMAFFPEGWEAMHTYTRPLNLKSPARPALQAVFDFQGQAGRMLSTAFGDLIPPELLSFAGPRQATPVRLILFPRYAAGSRFEVRRLTRAQAGLALMECLVNARNLPGHGFSEVARLARLAPAYRLSYSSFAQIGERIEILLRSV
jgi:hypothetical protein